MREFVHVLYFLWSDFGVSLVSAAKFYDDHYYDNLYYSKVGGISLQELNRLEVDLLFMIDFMLTVPSSVFATYRSELMRSAQPDDMIVGSADGR